MSQPALHTRFAYKRDGRQPGQRLLKGIGEVCRDEWLRNHNPVDGVPVYNGREAAQSFDLTTNGFMLSRLPTSCPDLFDVPRAVREYLPEAEEFLRRVTGCAECVAAGYTVRDPASQATRDGLELSLPDQARKAGRRGDEGDRHGIERNVHNDFTDDYHGRILSFLTPGGHYHKKGGLQVLSDPTQGWLGERIRRLNLDLTKCRFEVVNVWRAVGGGRLRRDPLAVCDKRTVSANDLIPASIKFDGRQFSPPGTAYTLAKHNPNHRWYYFPGMEEEEVLLLKTFDSRPEEWPLQIHTSIVDPSTAASDPPRRSCEIRAICIYPLEEEGSGSPAARL
eukprot:TRINITY_DN8218_c0_g1_i1.p1 TRINITY_DN8218_c0_g1~~TRINITY_DN8218_c0_g1_i1.p1  ORF type:complete len:356 (+),score=89.82 TRINITY_DN8218_c0_g1_i1:61-1068(+)